MSHLIIRQGYADSCTLNSCSWPIPDHSNKFGEDQEDDDDQEYDDQEVDDQKDYDQEYDDHEYDDQKDDDQEDDDQEDDDQEYDDDQEGDDDNSSGWRWKHFYQLPISTTDSFTATLTIQTFGQHIKVNCPKFQSQRVLQDDQPIACC